MFILQVIGQLPTGDLPVRVQAGDPREDELEELRRKSGPRRQPPVGTPTPAPTPENPLERELARLRGQRYTGDSYSSSTEDDGTRLGTVLAVGKDLGWASRGVALMSRVQPALSAVGTSAPRLSVIGGAVAKRLPIISLIVDAFDVGTEIVSAHLKDDGHNEEDPTIKKAKAKARGEALTRGYCALGGAVVGGVIGGIIGSCFGPAGTMIGVALGATAGKWLGRGLAGLVGRIKFW